MMVNKTKRALLIAFHYPPVKGSSGVQRALNFSKYLQRSGWDCDVLTVWSKAHAHCGDDELDGIPSSVKVVRAVALDVKRHLSLFGSYPQFMALPDNWANWRYDAIRRAKKLLREREYHVIWSTYPIATAHVIGAELANYSGLPWVADCRDSMTEKGYPSDPKVFKAYRDIESKMAREASAVTFTTPSAKRMYAQRYRQEPAHKWRVIENGYDEHAFSQLSNYPGRLSSNAPVVLVHAGILYPSERDPLPFFRAIAALKSKQYFATRPIKVVLRATGHDEKYQPVLRELGIDDVVSLEPGVPYREALQEMMLAEGLLIFQAANCNHQIPAKVYEYLRAGRPILALTDDAGDTAAVLRRNGHTHICDLKDQQAIEKQLTLFVEHVCTNKDAALSPKAEEYSRAAQTKQLAALFEELTGSSPA